MVRISCSSWVFPLRPSAVNLFRPSAPWFISLRCFSAKNPAGRAGGCQEKRAAERGNQLGARKQTEHSQQSLVPQPSVEPGDSVLVELLSSVRQEIKSDGHRPKAHSTRGATDRRDVSWYTVYQPCPHRRTNSSPQIPITRARHVFDAQVHLTRAIAFFRVLNATASGLGARLR